MAKAKAGAKKPKPAAKKLGKNKAKLLKKRVAAGARVAKPASKRSRATAKVTRHAPKAGKGGKAVVAPKPNRSAGANAADFSEIAAISPEKPQPRATKLPPVGQPLNKREMEELLTAGQGRGVSGEGSLKGRLLVRDGFPYLQVMGRDKRELLFLLQGPDQEVLPAYLDHKVSVSGFIKKTTNYGGIVDVRRYSAKKLGHEPPAATPEEEKLKYLSPGEIEQICAAGMGAGMKGFGSVRGSLEMTGDEFFLVVSNGGTRQQVSFLLEGKAAKGLRKHLGQVLQVTGVLEKSSGWGGRLIVETFEPRPMDHKAFSRDNLEIVKVEGTSVESAVETKLNQGLTVRLPERAGYTWAIEPTVAKRMGLREANYEPSPSGPPTREFFFTPRNPGTFEVDFFLAKAFSPGQVSKTFKLGVVVRP